MELDGIDQRAVDVEYHCFNHLVPVLRVFLIGNRCAKRLANSLKARFAAQSIVLRFCLVRAAPIAVFTSFSSSGGGSRDS
jgi:hypothetical protein